MVSTAAKACDSNASLIPDISNEGRMNDQANTDEPTVPPIPEPQTGGNAADVWSTEASNTKDQNSPKSPSRKRDIPDPTSPEGPSSKKMRDSPMNEEMSTIFPSASDYPATDHDRATWQGFCDIESDPAYFSVILREMGVEGIAVREVFAMTPDLLEMLPQPIYGLILLFRYREFGNADQPADCPSNVWFANQLPAQNSCGTLAMINILMNSPDGQIGEHLSQFKDFTKDLNPFQRGESFASFDYIKKIHNSFAKKMDLLENDKHLAYKVSRAKHRKELYAKPKNKTTKRRNRRASTDSAATNDSAEAFEENCHHFIAFVPVNNEVWKLDGYDKQPTSMGSFEKTGGETWLSNVSDTIATLMAAGDDEYGVLAITQSPLHNLKKQVSLVSNTMQCVESRLEVVDPSWKSFLLDDRTPDSTSTLHDQELLASNPVPTVLKSQIDAELLPDLLDRRAHLVELSQRLDAEISIEVQEEAEQNLRAAQRRYDCGPVIKKWLGMLAENGHLEENLDRFMPAVTKKRAR